MVFDLFLCLAAFCVVSAPLVAIKGIDYLRRKRFERMVDRAVER